MTSFERLKVSLHANMSDLVSGCNKYSSDMCRKKCKACPDPEPWVDFQLPHNLTGDFTLQLTPSSLSQISIHRNRIMLSNYGEFQVLSFFYHNELYLSLDYFVTFKIILFILIPLSMGYV